MTQLSKAQLITTYADAAGIFASNTTRDISEGDMRQFAQDLADSLYAILDNPGLAQNTDLYFEFQTDFTGLQITADGFSSGATSGMSASANYQVGNNNTEHAFGESGVTTGSESTGTVLMYRGSYTFGYGATMILRWRVILPVLSDGSETYIAIVGFRTSSISSDPTNGIYFRYTHSVNSGKWQCVTESASTETATDSGVTVDTVYNILEIRVNSDATSIGFYINGTLVQTHVDDIPVGTALIQGLSLSKSAGTTARTLVADWCEYNVTRTSAR